MSTGLNGSNQMIDTLEILGLWPNLKEHEPGEVTPEDESDRSTWRQIRLEVAREMERTRRLCEDIGSRYIPAETVQSAELKRSIAIYKAANQRDRLALQMLPLRHWIEIVQNETEVTQ